MSNHFCGFLWKGSCNECESDGDVSMVLSGFVAPVDVYGLFCSTDSDKVFSDFKADSAADINFELLLSEFDNCWVTLSLASAAATEKIVLVWLVFCCFLSSCRLFLFLASLL